MKKNLLNIALLSIFTLCTLPTFASENQTEESSKTTSEQIESQTPDVSEKTQKLPDMKALQTDYTKYLFAGCLFTSIALVLTLRELAQTKDELTLYKAAETARNLIKLESNDLKVSQAATVIGKTFAQTISSFIAHSQAALKRIVATDYNSHLFNDFFLSNF